MYVLELIWDNLRSAAGDMLLYGSIAFISGMIILFILNKIGSLNRKSILGKMMSGCYYFFIPFILSLGFAFYGGVKGVKREVIRDAHLTIDTAGEYSLGKFDSYLKEKGIQFDGHGITSDSLGNLFVKSVGADKQSWKGELMHWTISKTAEQLESRLVKEASERTGFSAGSVNHVTDYLEKGADGKEVGKLQEMGTSIAKNIVSKKIAFWINPYLWMILIFTLVIAFLPILHCVIHLLISGKPAAKEIDEEDQIHFR